jgi:hypothetical protein
MAASSVGVHSSKEFPVQLADELAKASLLMLRQPVLASIVRP